MSYRGYGGYRGDLLGIDSMGIDYSGSSFDVPTDPGDESMGLDTSTTPAPVEVQDYGGGSAIPDLSGLVGTAGLGGAIQKYGGALAPFLGGGLAGSAAGAGMGALAGPAAKALKKYARRIGIPGFGKSHRRMNPGNFRALHRAMRRLGAFEHAAKRVYAFRHRAPGRSHFKFTKRRRRR